MDETFKPNKKLGQNFLSDPLIILDFMEALGVTNTDTVMEIGPGLGSITRYLADRVAQVYAVEKDAQIIPHLKENLTDFTNIKIINEDILDLDMSHYGEVSKIAGAIPYNITSPLLHKIVKEGYRGSHNAGRVGLILQKEVALKICAPVDKGTYLSNFVQLYGKATLIKHIEKRYFNPIPKVDSSIIVLDKIDRSGLAIDIEKFGSFLHLGFSNPRKMLNKIFPNDMLINNGITPTNRAQNLTFDKWVELFGKPYSEPTEGRPKLTL